MKYLLWDFDNTLAYRDGMWSSTIFELLKEQGYSNLKIDDIRPHLSNGFPWHSPEIAHREFFNGEEWWSYMNKYFARVLMKLGIEKNDSKRISSCIRERYMDYNRWFVYDDTVSCLKSATIKGYSNIILSNHIPELEMIVNNLGIRDFFLKIYSSANLGYEKPNEKIFTNVISKLQNIESITMIGDSYNADILGALAAGIEAILVRKDNVYKHEKYFSSLGELADFL